MKRNKSYEISKDPEIKQRIREQLEGFKKMNEIELEEQRSNLPNMTREVSRTIFEELWLLWENSKKQNPNMGSLDQRKIEELVHRRRLFDRIAEGLTKQC